MLICVPLSTRYERAFRFAALAQDGHKRRGLGVPYFQHVVAVATILDRLGCDEDLLITGLLHDVVEDTDITLDEISKTLNPNVASLVSACSETKRDALGRERPWIDRKRGHLALLADASVDAKCLALADKLLNLISIEVDVDAGFDIWSTFHAEKADVLTYYRAVVRACRSSDRRAEHLAEACLRLIDSFTSCTEVVKISPFDQAEG